ncbi:phage portal protein [Novosphingobium sp. YJ-S2-02]|uniref:Phage portal protein n=1 Tax=Novosphingobium aureum TaxID=2792964 RepID=A0A931MLA2_9SPHN|nr:phage portal protein [Novosphingobium aureum]MBH0113274.1 phage portal protein [Novosphingobium aureum]
MSAPLPQDEFDELLAAPAAPPAAVKVPPSAGGEMAYGVHEAADRENSTIGLWSPPLQSVDADILPDKPIIDARARSMLSNDAFVQGGSNLHKDNIVGSHYLLNARPASRVLFGRVDDAWEEEFQEEVEEKWELYADSPDAWVDAARQNNFTSLVRMAVGIHLMAGEVLAAAEWVRDDGAPFRTAIQMIELDRLCTREDIPGAAIDPMVRAGIRFNARNAPVAYQIRTKQQFDYGPVRFGEIARWKEVARRRPWGRMQIVHLYETLRPEQTRGITEMASALSAMKKTHTWRDVNIQHAVTQSLYAAAITSDLPTEMVFAQLGGGNTSPKAMQDAVSNYAKGFLGSVSQYVGKARGLQIDGVQIPHLFPGTKLDMLSPGKGGPLGQEFEQSLLRYIAASIGVSYEQLSRDYTNTNYSSARAAMTETWKFMQARKKMIADRFATIVYRLWLEEAIQTGQIETAKRPGFSIYAGRRLGLSFDAIARCDWIGASRGQIDEGKETEAAIARINAGLSTAEDELARLGKDWRKVFRQIRREQELRRTLGLVLPGLAGGAPAPSAQAPEQQDTAS